MIIGDSCNYRCSTYWSFWTMTIACS